MSGLYKIKLNSVHVCNLEHVYSVRYAYDYVDVFALPALCLSVCQQVYVSLFKCIRVCASVSVYMCFCARGTVDICALTYIGLLV